MLVSTLCFLNCTTWLSITSRARGEFKPPEDRKKVCFWAETRHKAEANVHVNIFTRNQSWVLKSSKSLLGYLHVCLLLCCEGLEPPFIGKKQKQSAATRGSCVSGSAFHSSYRCHFTHTSQQKQTSPDISCIFTQTNSPEALKASHVWPMKHTHTHIYAHTLRRRRDSQSSSKTTSWTWAPL